MNKIAKALLDSKSVHIEPNPDNYFTWTSGKRSPIYCDNRQLISYPGYRKLIVEEFVNYIQDQHSEVELIAGTATAGIPWAAWISHELNLPMIYIRSKAKGHGLKSALEGKFEAGQKTLIIEDLISTGKSSLEAYDHASNDNLEIQSVLSIFNYGFQEAKNAFNEKNVNYHSLCNLDELLAHAHNEKLLNESDVEAVGRWARSFK